MYFLVLPYPMII